MTYIDEMYNVINKCIKYINSLEEPNECFNKNYTLYKDVEELYNKCNDNIDKWSYLCILKFLLNKCQIDTSDKKLIMLNKLVDITINSNITKQYDYIYQILIKKYTDPLQLLNFITKYLINNFTVYETFYWVCSKMLKNDINKNIKYKIIEEIESIKYSILSQTIDIKYKLDDFKINILCNAKKIKTKLLYDINPFIKNYGLSPATHYYTLDNLYEFIFKKKKSKITEESFSNDDIFIIVISKCIQKSLEFDITKIYGSLSKLYKQGLTDGINLIMVDKFKTIKFSDRNKKWGFIIKVYGHVKDKCLILEKNNDNNYRIMLKYENINTKYDQYKQLTNITNYYNNPHNIYGLLNFINGNSTDRIDYYNKNLEHNILKNMFIINKIDIDEIKETSKIIDITLLKYDLYDILNKLIIKLYNPKKKDRKHLLNIIHDEVLINSFSDFLINNYISYVVKNCSDLTTYTINELLKTFLSQLVILRISVQKKLHDEFIARERNLKDTDILQFFEELLIGVMDQLISVDNNIYLSLIFKTQILSIENYDNFNRSFDTV